MKIMDVVRETGLNRTAVTALYYEKAQRVDLDAVEKLCELFDCQVGDFFERVRSHASDDVGR